MPTIVGMAVLAALIASPPPADPVPTPQPCHSDLVVGCFYFPGHFSPLRWTPMRRAGFPIPLLGYYRDGEPEVMDWHIKWAVEHGIDYFAFDWYCHYKHGPSGEHNLALDRGFLRARYRELMNFCLMWCNEGKDERYTEAQMVELAGLMAEQYFKQPNHLRIDGDNVLIVSVPGHFLASFGPEGTKRVFERMGEATRRAGCGGLFPVAKGHADQAKLEQAGFRAITAYNYPYAGMTPAQKKARRAPYQDMVRGYEEIWKQVTGVGVLPYIVPVSPGWDSRPWYGEQTLVRTNPRPRLFYEMCAAAKRYVDPKLRMVLAECWNEFGEGSYIEPTVRYGFGSLDAMRDAFCEDNPQHEDLVPLNVGRRPPTFADVPESAERLMAAGANMLHNGDMEGDWGWVTYRGGDTPRIRPGRQGRWCLRVPSGQGVKTQWHMPVPKDRRVRVVLWYRVPAGATLSIKAALFKSISWLERYADVATLARSDGQWTKLDKTMTVTDPEATHFDIEFIGNGGDCNVDDVDVRAVASQGR